MEIMRVKQQDGTIVDIPIGIGMTETEVDQKIIEAKSEVMNVINSDYASKEYVEQEIATFDFIKVANELPEVGLVNRFYLVPKQDVQTQDLFDEYVWINKGTEEEPNWGWEWITTKQIEVDLTDYTTINKVEEMLLERSKKEHEVGSLYVSMSSTDPAQIFGFGTWNLIAKNSFLVGAGDAYEAGDTGGEETVTLSTTQVPKVEGIITLHNGMVATNVHKVEGCFSPDVEREKYIAQGDGTAGASSVGQIKFSNGGNNEAHNNMPPYIAVYIWKRIA